MILETTRIICTIFVLQANIHSMMASEAQVEALMEMIDTAYTEAEKIESRLDSYDEILQHVKDSIEKIADKNTSIEQTNANNSKLLEELDRLIVSCLIIPHIYNLDTYILDIFFL